MARGKTATAAKVYRQTGSRELARSVLLRELFGDLAQKDTLGLAARIKNPAYVLCMLDRLDLDIIAEYKKSSGCSDLEAETALIKMLEESNENS